MTICRYYARGTCRFGDRCRFEHVESNYNYNQQSYNYNQQSYNYNQRNVDDHQQRYGRPESGYSNYNQYGSNERYEPRNYYSEDYRSYSPQRYTENNRYQSGGYEVQQQNKPRQDYGQPNYGRQQFSNYRENENVYGQNRYRWLSEDYKNQVHPNSRYNENEYSNDSYVTSTPKAKPSFSFKVPESEIKKGNSTAFQVNEDDQLTANIVKEDAKAWEIGGQWPFTCYFPYPNKSGFPGFYDVSPEEMRYAAYNAEKDNIYETYRQSVQNALTQVTQQRSQLQIVTPQLLSTLKRIRNGEDLYSTTSIIDPLASIPKDVTIIESMETPSFAAPADTTLSSFSFKMPTETDSTVKTGATNFSFKLPAGTEIKAIPAAVSDGDVNIFTPSGNLTDEEKVQFSASTFVLGKIPTRPPPQILCS